MMGISVVLPEIEIHTTPLEELFIDSTSITIFFDDINENRYKIIAEPYQAINITTIDCVSCKEYYNSFCYRDGIFHRHILQVENSELLCSLIKRTNDNQFLMNSKHYVLPLQDNLIEFLAYDFKIEKADNI